MKSALPSSERSKVCPPQKTEMAKCILDPCPLSTERPQKWTKTTSEVRGLCRDLHLQEYGAILSSSALDALSGFPALLCLKLQPLNPTLKTSLANSLLHMLCSPLYMPARLTKEKQPPRNRMVLRVPRMQAAPTCVHSTNLEYSGPEVF